LQAALETYLARAGEVVSNRHIAVLMEELYPDAASNGPWLYKGSEVTERLALTSPSVEARGAAREQNAAPAPPIIEAPHGYARGQSEARGSEGEQNEVEIGPLSLAPSLVPSPRRWPWVMVGALLATVVAGGAALLFSSSPAPSAAQAKASTPAVSHPAPAVPVPEPATPAARMELPAPSTPEPTPNDQTPSRETPRSARRRASPGFVADPGF
jgi:hypothetical protein